MIGFDYFLNLFSPHDNLVIFDVGAHVGDAVEEFLTLYTRAEVFAFEPDPDNFSQLKSRFSKSSRVKLFNAAVGQLDGRALLHRNNYNATHSLLPIDETEINRWADADDFHATGVKDVNQVSLDNFSDSHGIDEIDILKLDIQGSEMMALAGGEKKFSKQQFRAIFCEVEFRQLYRNQPLFCDITQWLASRGYHFVNFVNPKVTEMGVIAWADAIYVNHELWQSIAEKHSAGKLVYR